MSRPVKVYLYVPPNTITPQTAEEGWGEVAPYTTTEDWVNPDAVVDVSLPRLPPPASARSRRGQQPHRQYQGSVECTVLHVDAGSPYADGTGWGSQPPVDRTRLVIGSVPAILDRLWPPTEPDDVGVSIGVASGDLEIEGLRAGCQTRFIGGETAYLDPRLLRGTEWRIQPLSTGTQAVIKLTAGKGFNLQVRGSDGNWSDVATNTAITARNRYRARHIPAPAE